MSFLALLIAVAILQTRSSLAAIHRDSWFAHLQGRLIAWHPLLQLLCLVLLPTLVLLGAQLLVSNKAWGLLSLLLSVVALLYAFGRGEFEALMARYQSYCDAGDFEGAFLYVEAELGFVDEVDVPQNPQALHSWVQRRLAYSGFERWFAPVFAFLLLGPTGALGYRLLQLTSRTDRESATARLADQILQWVDWIPARLLGLSCALTGDFVASREPLLSSLRQLAQPNDAVLHELTRSALGLGSSEVSTSNDRSAFAQMAAWESEQLGRLLVRSAVAWLVCTALVVILS